MYTGSKNDQTLLLLTHLNSVVKDLLPDDVAFIGAGDNVQQSAAQRGDYRKARFLSNW